MKIYKPIHLSGTMNSVLLLLAGVLMAPNFAFAAITGSAHDFSGKAYTTEICNLCHTPHNADVSQLTAPLWNHAVTSTVFTLYTDTYGTLDAVTAQPVGITKMCLSCHDGTIGIDNFGGSGSNLDLMTGDALLGTDLSDDHPVAFLYDAALATADGELYDPTSELSGLGDTIEADMLFGTPGAATLECASCHDVHNASQLAYLLVKSNVSSGLCLTCHDK